MQDTAGVRSETNGLIEQEGIKRAVRAAAQADFVVAMVDSTDRDVGLEIIGDVLERSQNDDSKDGTNALDPRHVLLVLNKVDLQRDERSNANTSANPLLDRIGGCFEVSCVTQQGIDSFLTDFTKRVGNRVGAFGDYGTA